MDNVVDLRLAEDVFAVLSHAGIQRQVKQLLGDYSWVMEQAHVHNFDPFDFQVFVAADKNFSTLLKNDVSVCVLLWDRFFYVGYWVHYFNAKVKRLKYARVHLD